jgi:hypothetical protein
MRHSNQGWFRQQFGIPRHQSLLEGDLPFTNMLSKSTIAPALDAVDFEWKDRNYAPLVTFWGFLAQVLSADHSCRSAVSQAIARRLSQRQAASSGKTGAYR